MIQVNRRDTFVAMGAGGSMFRSSERQQIIDYIIRSKIKDGELCLYGFRMCTGSSDGYAYQKMYCSYSRLCS